MRVGAGGVRAVRDRPRLKTAAPSARISPAQDMPMLSSHERHGARDRGRKHQFQDRSQRRPNSRSMSASLQLDVGRAAVVALAGAGGGLHLAQQRVHLARLEPAAGAHAAVAGHGASTRPPAAPSSRLPCRLGEASSARSRTRPLTSVSPSRAGTSRTSTAPGPNASTPRPRRPARRRARPAPRPRRARASTISGISRAWRATPPLASAAFMRS